MPEPEEEGVGLDVGWKRGPRRTSITIANAAGTKITLAHESTTAGAQDAAFLVGLLPAAMNQIVAMTNQEDPQDAIEK